MAFATQLTIATGHTIYAGDPESDERIKSQEVRVEVTYHLERDDTDVLLLAAVKAAEVARTHELACRQILSAHQVSDEDFTEENEDPAFAAPPYPAAPAHNGHQISNGSTAANGSHTASQGLRGPSPATSAPAPQAAEEPAITTPQRLAIKEAAKRQHISDQALYDLLHTRFNKFRLERLTKDEAATLLLALQRGEWQQWQGQPAAVTHYH